MRAIIVGAGGLGRALLERLGEHWQVTAVDVDAERLESLSDMRAVERVVGDGSSRLTLQRAGLEQADAVIIAARDDDVALEISRIATQANVPRVVAMVVSAARSGEFTRLGATVIAPDRLTARQVELVLEPRRIASAAFADGRAEAIEFHLAPDSSLVGRTLAELSLHGWLVAAILRDDGLIVPHGATRFMAGDRVTVVGPAADHAVMVDVFTEGKSRFPLSHGRRVGVTLDESNRELIAEAIAFSRLTAAEALVVVHPRRSALDDDSRRQLEGELERLSAAGPHVEFAEGSADRVGLGDLIELREREHFGCLVVPRPRGLRAAVSLMGKLDTVRLPALLAAGVPRYERLVIPARESDQAWAAAWVALDLAAHNNLPIEALGASSPRFLVTDDDQPALRAAVMRLRDEGSIRGVEVAGHVVRGNPIRLFRAVGHEALLVLSAGLSRPNLVRPGFTASVAAGRAGSMLVVPAEPARP